MALPATRVLTGKYTDPVTGEPLAGSVILSPHPAVWTDTAGNQLMMTREVIELDSNGEFSQAVVRTDAPDVLPVQGKLWRYTENIRDNSNSGRSRTPAPARTFYFEVSDGVGPLDITDVAPTEPGQVPPAGAAGGDLTGTYPDPSLANTPLARSHLGLGDSATRDVGTTAGTVAAGDDPRLALNTNAVQRTGDTMTGELQIVYNDFDVDVARGLSIASSTGIVYTSGPLTQASSTSVNVPAGVAVFADHTALTQSFKTVQYGPAVVTITDLTDPLTYFMVDDTGAIVQNAGVPTRQQRREFAILGRAVVLSSVITSVQDSPILATHPVSFIQDLVNALGDVRVDGIRLNPVTGTLMFGITAGSMLNPGANYQNDPNDPNVSPFNAVSPAGFRYVTQTTVIDVTPRTVVNPDLFDVGGTATVVGGGSGRTTIQRVHCFPTQNVFIQLGQQVYNSLTLAIDALAVGEYEIDYVTHPDLRGGGVLTGFLVMNRVATDLDNNADARILRATRLGDPGGL